MSDPQVEQQKAELRQHISNWMQSRPWICSSQHGIHIGSTDIDKLVAWLWKAGYRKMPLKWYQAVLGELKVDTHFRFRFGSDYWLVEHHSIMGTACLRLRDRAVRAWSSERIVRIDVPQ